MVIKFTDYILEVFDLKLMQDQVFQKAYMYPYTFNQQCLHFITLSFPPFIFIY